MCVVGAGITGLTCALLLKRAGRDVVLVEAERLGTGTTAHSSAHLTVMPDLRPTRLRQRVGADAARAAIRAGRHGLERVAAIARELGGCGFERLPGYLWAHSDDELGEIGKIASLLADWGESVEAPVDVPLPGGARGLRLNDQAAFQPMEYLCGLARLAAREGVRIHERSPVTGWHGGHPCRIEAAGKKIEADHLVLATHTPPGFVPSVQARMLPFVSYLIVVRLREALPPGLYWDLAEPYHYLRPLVDGWALVGGEDTKPGAVDPREPLRTLEAWARARLPVLSVEDRWMHGFFEPADGLPYIGRLPGQGSVWVGAGYSGTGLTWGSFAAERIAAGILGHANVEDAHWSPRRVELAGFDRVAQENFDVLWHFVADRLRPDGDLHPADLAPGEGRIVDADGRKVAVWRDPNGALVAMSPFCRHMGCVVHWNQLDRTWDCPCHGGRYHADGTRLYGPPTRDLERRTLTAALPVAGEVPAVLMGLARKPA